MAVLVDEARWSWRDTTWAHLVSDESPDELHDFAQRLGKRRLGFQGDHYDVDVVDRQRAIGLGALATPSRELVRRLRAAGLRRRDAKPTWDRLLGSDEGSPLDLGDRVDNYGVAGRLLTEAVASVRHLSTAARCGVFVDVAHLVLLVDVAPAIELTDLSDSVADELWISGPRADGWRSMEFFVRRQR